MKKLELEQMEQIEAGATKIGCAWLGWAAGLATAELGPISFAIGAATYAGCIQS